ncbi:MAG TPA: hypothetical protein VGH28_15690 [Polyangiaceae bacterium]|jgi:hypothetical protein
MANAAHNAPLKIGKLSPEEAERISASFRPIWELDDAPFAQGNGLSAADVDALAAGAGVAPSVRGSEQVLELKPEELKTDVGTASGFAQTTRMTPPPRVPAPDEPKVEIAIDIVEPPPPPRVAEARPQPVPTSQAPTVARKPYTPPRPPPAPVKMQDANASADFVPVKKSNTGLILAAVGVVVLVGGIFGVRSMMSDSSKASTSTATTATSEPTQEATHIPPPPPDTAPATTNVAATAATQTQQAVQEPAPTHTAEPPPVETHTAHVAPPPTHVAVHTAPHVAHPHASGKSTIVRDNPF